jgi:hypothetical protein
MGLCSSSKAATHNEETTTTTTTTTTDDEEQFVNPKKIEDIATDEKRETNTSSTQELTTNSTTTTEKNPLNDESVPPPKPVTDEGGLFRPKFTSEEEVVVNIGEQKQDVENVEDLDLPPPSSSDNTEQQEEKTHKIPQAQEKHKAKEAEEAERVRRQSILEKSHIERLKNGRKKEAEKGARKKLKLELPKPPIKKLESPTQIKKKKFHHLGDEDETWLLWALFRYYSAIGNRTSVGRISRTQFMKLCKDANIMTIDKNQDEDGERITITKKSIDILFQQHQYIKSPTNKDNSGIKSPKSNSTKHLFGDHKNDRKDSKKAKHSLDFDTFVELVTDVAIEMYKEETYINTPEIAFTYLLETHFIALAMNNANSSPNTNDNKVMTSTPRNIKVMKGHTRRASAVNINIEKVGKEVAKSDVKKKERRSSTTAMAAEALEMAISNRMSIQIDNTTSDEKRKNFQLLTKFDKPLKRVFDFYCTLTKVAPGGHSVPSNIVRTHLTYQDTSTLLRDFYLLPAYVSNSSFQEIWHENQLGRDHNEYINWLSFVEFKHLLNTISHQIPLPKGKKRIEKERNESDNDDDISLSLKQLGRLLSGLDRGIPNMQKRGATFLPRFYSVTYEERK